METIRRILERIRTNLSLLTLSQRLAIGLCAVVVAGSLAWLVQWSATPELVELLPQDLSPQELNAAQAALETARVEYKIVGSRILVPPGDQMRVLDRLNQGNALPRDISLGFDKLIGETSPFLPESERRIQYNLALGNELAKVIASAPDVQDAHVFITPDTKRTLGTRGTQPTAAIHIRMVAGRELSQAQAHAHAMLVARAVPGLDPHNVSVIDSARSRAFSIMRPEEQAAAGQLDEVRRREDYQRGKIMEQLSYIPGVLANVSIDLDTTKSITESISYTGPEEKLASSDVSETGQAAPGEEPGVNPNVGASVASTGGGERSTTESQKTENFPPMPSETKKVEKLPFNIKRTTATVRIPRSFFVSVYRAQDPQAKDPTDDELKPLMDLEFERVKKDLKKLVMSDSDVDVEVSFFYDLDLKSATFASATGGAEAAAQDGATMGLLRSYGPQAGLGGLALFSLLMMFMMARKAARIAAPPPPPRATESDEDAGESPEQILMVGGGPIGQAAVSEAFLTGHEVDEEALRYQQLSEQITKMVDEDPDSVADLIRRMVEADA